MDCSGSQTFEAQAHGAPVEHVIPVDGAMIRHRMLTVPKMPSIQTQPSFSPLSC